MEAVKVKKSKASVKVSATSNLKAQSTMTVNDVMEIQQAIQKMLQTSTALKGKYVKVFLGNMEILEPILAPVIKEQNEVVKKYVPMDDNDQPKRNGEGFKFDNDDDAQKFDADSKKNWSTPASEFKFLKMSALDFDEMPIDTSKNDSMYLILKYLVNQS